MGSISAYEQTKALRKEVVNWWRGINNRVTLLESSPGSTYTFSTGLTNTAGTVTANLATGKAGGQSVIGGTANSENLTLSSTAGATKGKILFGTSAYDETGNRLELGSTPVYLFGTASATFNSTPSLVLWNTAAASSITP